MNILRSILVIASVLATGRLAGDEPILDVEVTVDFGRDLGQNRGSLFEAYDADGKVVAGAGFLGAYNTRPRSNRDRLHFFLKPTRFEYSRNELPRVNAHQGTYLSDQYGSLYARTRNGSDAGFYALQMTSKRWTLDKAVTNYDIRVAGKTLRVTDRSVIYEQQTILKVDVTTTRIRENYYAGGMLILRLQGLKASGHSNRLIAIPWKDTDKAAAYDPETNLIQKLSSHGEFAYAIGQLGDEALVATNTGGVYSLGPRGWRAIVKPGPHSYQVYAMLNYYDRLLLGHYPTGELFEYDGKELRHLPGWPPVLPGVSKQAREAQTLAIYGGDLYVGVWPWAEVWRYDRNAANWQFVQRMFSHPTPTNETQHPYEKETAAITKIYNLWGQRVTSMVPFDDALYISTSSKTGVVPPPKFLTAKQGADYGRVHELRLPGQLSVELDWSEKPVTLRCVVTADTMSLWQEGELKAKRPVVIGKVLDTGIDRVTWGKGVYGPLAGELMSKRSNRD